MNDWIIIVFRNGVQYQYQLSHIYDIHGLADALRTEGIPLDQVLKIERSATTMP